MIKVIIESVGLSNVCSIVCKSSRSTSLGVFHPNRRMGKFLHSLRLYLFNCTEKSSKERIEKMGDKEVFTIFYVTAFYLYYYVCA